MRRRSKFAAAAAVAGAAILGTAIPASAYTLEFGTTRTCVISNAPDFKVAANWHTTYNAVGTSSTEPGQMYYWQASGGPLTWKFAKSVRIRVWNGAGTVAHGSKVVNIDGPNTDSATSPSILYTPVSSDFSNVLLSDSPKIQFQFYSGANATGTQFCNFDDFYL